MTEASYTTPESTPKEMVMCLKCGVMVGDTTLHDPVHEVKVRSMMAHGRGNPRR